MSSAADLPFYSSSLSSTSEESESEASDSEDSALAGGGNDDRVTGCYLRGTLSNAPKVSDLIESEEENPESEAFSDIGDNSDISHIAVKNTDMSRTPEDVDLALIDSIAAHLRVYPLLPPDVSDPKGEGSFKDVASGIRFPIVHCGFKRCSWQSFQTDEVKLHWDLEFALSQHLQEVHRDSEMKCLPAATWHQPGQKHYRMDAYAYYNAAVMQKEQQHIPIIGPANDRRMLTLLHKLANSDTLQSAVCFVCAQMHTAVQS